MTEEKELPTAQETQTEQEKAPHQSGTESCCGFCICSSESAPDVEEVK